jgi:uncharacterized protein (TIGR02145 family)
MKKVLLIIALFMLSLTLKAAEPKVKFYLEDGNSKEYRIEDVTEMSFNKSVVPYIMEIYMIGSVSTYNILYINSMEFENLSTLTINFANSSEKFNIQFIDSIIFVPNIYNQITIENQTWMGKNLDVDHYRNGDTIPQVTDSLAWSNLKTGAWCYYNNDPNNSAVYGKLYNWYAVHDPRGLAPVGWHIPSDAEWTRLTYNLGGESIAGGKLKSVTPNLWRSPNAGATNETGFNAQPGGYRYITGNFFYLGDYGFWWSSTSSSAAFALYRNMNYDDSKVDRSDVDKEVGFSVRCIKDLGSNTPIIHSISPTSAAIGDVITISGFAFGSSQETSCVSFNLVKLQPTDYISWSDYEIKAKVPIGAATGGVSVTVNGVKSESVDFTLTGATSGEYVTIGSQVWMKKNLDVVRYRNGDLIPQVNDSTQWANLKTGAWCYYSNKNAYGAISGRLYNWYAVNDPRGLAPEGWHIASDAEWTTLSDFLGGEDVAGGKMKEVGVTHWQSPNKGATNESGFTGLPGGYRYENKSFNGYGVNGYWWCSTESDANIANARYLSTYDSAMHTTVYYKRSALSVRCIIGNYSNTPTINLISPSIAQIGDIITISGTAFGTDQGTSFISFNALNPLKSDYQSWSDQEIKVKVPVGASSGKVSLTVNGTKSNKYDFIVTNLSSPPHILSISPNSGTIGDTVTIEGNNFGTYQDQSFVTFDSLNPKLVDYIGWDDNEIKVKVPQGASSGKLYVTVNLLQSNKVDFSVIYHIEYGTVTDIDGNVYKTIKINNQWWMDENLNVSHYQNGNPIPLVTDAKKWSTLTTSACCFYKNLTSNGTTYGRLYNWYAASDARNIAPEGWHVATDAEWTNLANYLGSESMAGGKMKSKGTIENGDGLWYKPNTGATDDVGFSALPGGCRTKEGVFAGLGYDGNWWRPTSGSQSGAWYRNINYQNIEILRVYDDKLAGYSVRCVKD